MGDELNARAAGVESVQCVGLRRPGFRQFGREIELIRPAGHLLADEFALIGLAQALQHIAAGRVIRPHHKDLLDPLLIEVEAERLRRLIVVERGREHVGRTHLAGELRRAGIGDHRDRLCLNQRLQRAQHDVRPDVTGNEVDVIGFEQFLRLLHADFGLLLVVLVNDLNRQAAELATEMIEPELKRVFHVGADRAGGPAERTDKPDFDGLILSRGRPCQQRESGRRYNCNALHGAIPSHYRTRRCDVALIV